MISRMALLLKGKMVVAVILGTLVVAGGGTTIAVAASGAKVSLPLVTQTSSSEHHSASSNTGNSSEGTDNSHSDGQQAEGTISSIDSGHNSFTLTPEHGDAVTVVVNAQTEFEGGLRDFSGLKVGQHVEVTGTRQTDGSLLATKVEGQDENANDNENEQNENQDEHDLNGTIMSIDATSSTFVLKLSDGTTTRIAVSANTEFDGDNGLQSFSDLKVGLVVEVEGNLQSNGIVTAAKVHREDSSSSSDGGGSNGGDNGSGSGSGDGDNASGNGSSSSGANGK